MQATVYFYYHESIDKMPAGSLGYVVIKNVTKKIYKSRQELIKAIKNCILSSETSYLYRYEKYAVDDLGYSINTYGIESYTHPGFLRLSYYKPENEYTTKMGFRNKNITITNYYYYEDILTKYYTSDSLIFFIEKED